MSKNTLIIVIFFLNNLVYSQTKSETLNWLNEYYDKYGDCGEAHCDFYVDDNNFLIYRRKTTISDDFKKINLKKIKRIIFKQDKIISTWAYIYLECDSDEHAGFSISYYNSSPSYYPRNYMSITFYNNFYTDKIHLRYLKALLHIVKISGGNAKIISNRKKSKEPF